ncbi:glycosyltransferase [Chishuiella sp.]|uniref:glycosyltransferase family 32 protein n=1 Tax=Chishuiella sp. TaxID=1969467 RepID=UPI0028AE1BB6|nr:glycosyltransferase [Chishuiella sp.]
MIPKLIHYCWFGNQPKNESILNYIKTWKYYNPDFKIIEWNDNNVCFDDNIYVKEAYKQKKWAFVSDYIRVVKVLEFGGFYLDTDMEVTSSFKELLSYKCVCGFELLGKPFSAFFGAIPNHEFVQDMVNYYNDQNEFVPKANTEIFSKLLIDKYKANPYLDNFQLLNNDIALFPSSAFSLDIPKNYVIHHFDGSWLNTEQSFFKRYVNMYGILNQLIISDKSKESINHLIYHNKIFTIDQILDVFPLKFVIKYVYKKIINKIFRK